MLDLIALLASITPASPARETDAMDPASFNVFRTVIATVSTAFAALALLGLKKIVEEHWDVCVCGHRRHEHGAQTLACGKCVCRSFRVRPKPIN